MTYVLRYQLFPTKMEELNLENFNELGKQKGLVISSWNIRSIVSKFQQIETIVADADIDILCVNETWLGSMNNSNAFALEGYDLFRHDRVVKKRGGVSVSTQKSP